MNFLQTVLKYEINFLLSCHVEKYLLFYFLWKKVKPENNFQWWEDKAHKLLLYVAYLIIALLSLIYHNDFMPMVTGVTK
jgi:hypothetical protein